jgi:hypothetical protein
MQVIVMLQALADCSAIAPDGSGCDCEGSVGAGWVCPGRGLLALDCLRNSRDHGRARERHSL